MGTILNTMNFEHHFIPSALMNLEKRRDSLFELKTGPVS